ncbi:hypothetical protein B0H17DRAFT_1194702 [Mycena rosella]|uniref:Uncharacterized protein n=1 Tax=Mycena rosella TaxID=1033263 RepID=A0AAD7GRC4_MYCRO|nr:hypothetical protein B0H17DRAFT_1194702 [Mycena rosella]
MDLRHPQYNFPPVPFQYITPDQYYRGLPRPPAPYGPVPQPENINTSQPPPVTSIPSPQPAPQPSPPPVKRRPGCPRKDVTGLKSPQRAAKAAAKKATVKAAAKPKTVTKFKRNDMQKAAEEEKENIELLDSDSEIEGMGRKHSKDDEKTKVFNFILAQDEAGDYRFEQHKKNPMYIYKQASEKLFNGSRTAKSIGSLWARSPETFGWIVVFEGFTGNGGGDPELNDPVDILGYKMQAAREASVVIGDLKPEAVMNWEKNGWHDLFNACLGASTKVSRQVVRNSAAALSDLDINVDDEVNSGDDTIDPSLRIASKTPAPAKSSVAMVSEPKHTPASRFHVQANNSLGNMGDYIKIKILSEKKAKAMDAKLELDQAKLALEKQKADAELQKSKIEMARAVIQMEGVENSKPFSPSLLFQPIICLACRNLYLSLDIVHHDLTISIVIGFLIYIFL